MKNLRIHSLEVIQRLTVCLMLSAPCWVVTLHTSDVLATEIEESDVGAPAQDYSKLAPAQLLKALTQVSLGDLEAVLVAIESRADLPVATLFNALQAGQLHFDEASGLLYIQTELQTQALLTGEVIASTDHLNLTKVRVNNALRSYLKSASARLNLRSADSVVREQAVNSLLADLDEPLAKLIGQARLAEKSPRVQAAMDVALAMYRAKNSEDANLKAQAVTQLSKSQLPEVRALLEEMQVTETEPVVQKALFAALRDMVQRSQWYNLLGQLVFGLSLGSVLLLAAIGLAITFGVMGVINMAHGEMMMLGAYTTYVVQLWMPQYIDQSLWVAIPLAFMVSGLVGILIQQGVIRFLQGRPLETLLATFGISLILQQTVRTIFSPLNRQVAQPTWMSGSLEINPEFGITLNRLYIFGFALLVFLILQLILKKTNLGLHVRAVSQNRNMARSMGIRTERVDALTFGLGSGIAGIAGVALSQLTNVGPNLGQNYIIDSFMVVVFGGVGNLLGTLVAAFTLGIGNKFLEPLTGAVLASILILIFIILFIQKRPKGLFPQKGRAAE